MNDMIVGIAIVGVLISWVGIVITLHHFDANK